MNYRLKKLPFQAILIWSFTLVFLVLVGVLFWKNYQTFTVAQGERNNGLGTTYGYSIENYRYTRRVRITIWAKSGLDFTMKSVYDFSRLSVDKVGTEEWLGSDSAIYLKLQLIDHASLNSLHSTRIIYDYHSGQIFLTSDLNLWRIWSKELGGKDWLTGNAFNEILAEFRQEYFDHLLPHTHNH